MFCDLVELLNKQNAIHFIVLFKEDKEKMFHASRIDLRTRKLHKIRKYLGSPGAPTMKYFLLQNIRNVKVMRHMVHADLVMSYYWGTQKNQWMFHYMGKHHPAPQKALWSPDTPVPMDRMHYKLTTLDFDAFKFWFGVRRCQLDKNCKKLLMKAGLLPPSLHQNDMLVPRPIFDKEELYEYFLKTRKDMHRYRSAERLLHGNGVIKTKEEREADRPMAPWT